jgi:hypothetical protein
MDQSQFEVLRGNPPPDPKMFSLTYGTFSGNDADRTLLYGYDCERRTHHVYLQHGMVYQTIYENGLQGAVVHDRTNWSSSPITLLEVKTLIPNKRLYPERCDFEFCRWLISYGLEPIFTVFDETQAVPDEKGFYGVL